MNVDEIVARVRAMHKPEAIAEAMVWEVWEDGEVTLTKGGDLYGRRNLHLQEFGLETPLIPADALFPVWSGAVHSRIAVATQEEARVARRLLTGEGEV